MASVLQRTSRIQNLDAIQETAGGQEPAGRYPGNPGSGTAFQRPATFRLAKAAAGNVGYGAISAMSDGVPCRGVRLLLKAKEFHLAIRGLQETSGYRYILNQPKRQAHHSSTPRL